ncbi:MAG: hypothetical protein V3W41_14425 [Planctomycetota bacterium]
MAASEITNSRETVELFDIVYRLGVQLANVTPFGTLVAGTILARTGAFLVPYDPAGAGDITVPVGVLGADVVNPAAGGQFIDIRHIVGGGVRRELLDVFGVGAATDIDVDALRSVGIIPVAVKQLRKT